MKIIENYLTRNRCYTNGIKINVRGLMLHSVGCPQPSAAVFMRNWNTPSVSVCVHGFIEPDGEVYQCLPWNVKGRHGGGSSNSTHIGVEMTEPASIKYTGGANFVDNDPERTKEHIKGTYKTAVELFAYLCKEYGLNPALDIISHREGHALGIASNHGDPEHLWSKYPELGYSMDSFRADVQKKMNNSEEEIDMDINEARKKLTSCADTGDTPSEWAREAAEYCKQKGIFNGDGAGNYGWQQPITREAVAQIIYNVLEQAGALNAIPDK